MMNESTTPGDAAPASDWLKVIPQYLLPQHFLSRLMHRFMAIRIPLVKNLQIRFVAWKYQVNLAEAEHTSPDDYPTFNHFFTRTLRASARPVCEGATLACPADGRISAIGTIEDGKLLQAKGRNYALKELLGGQAEYTESFRNGLFITVYLSPRDYHRVHMPLDAKLLESIHVPGRLFSVNAATTRRVDNLFARNERLVCLYNTALGPMAVILVGAIFVGSMETVWEGKITPPYGSRIQTRIHPGDNEALNLNKGDEMGRFNMGSTVIVLLPENSTTWADQLQAGSPVQMGQALGKLRAPASLQQS